MGNPTFYWFPTPNSGHLETLDLGEGLGELSTAWELDANTGVSVTGKSYRSCGLHRQTITISRDRMLGGEAMAHKLAGLQNHLDRGFSVGFSVDSSKAWIAPVKSKVFGGQSVLQVGNNPFRDIVGTNTPANDDYFCIETGSPSVVYEVKKKQSGTISVYTGGAITFTDPISFSLDQPAWCRWYRYWPVLKRPQSLIGQNIVTNESGLLWNLSLTLVTDTDTLFSFWSPEEDGNTTMWPPTSDSPTFVAEAPALDQYDLIDFPDQRTDYRVFDDNINPLNLNPRNWWNN
tara:strand:+ start:1471 stop:2337 length:867 start_codon:yes stop_codon:yes gene_type:complete